MAFKVEDDSFDVLGCSGHFPCFIVAASLVMQGTDDQVAIYSLATTGSILQQTLGLTQIYQGFLEKILFYHIFGLSIKIF